MSEAASPAAPALPESVAGLLTPAEERYFSSGGEVSPEEAPPPAAPVAAETGADEPTAEDRSLEQTRRLAVQKIAASVERLERIAKGSAEEAAARPPTIEEDPLHVLRTLAQRVENGDRAAAEASYVNSLAGELMQREAVFAEKTPDYPSAAEFLRKSLDAELEVLNPAAPAAWRSAELQRYALAITETALRNGRDPAQAAYAMARRRGYSGAAQPAAADVGNSVRTRDAARPRAEPGEAKMRELLAMDTDDFAAVDEKTWRKVMGGAR